MDKVIKKCKTHYEINKKEERKNPKTNFQPNRQKNNINRTKKEKKIKRPQVKIKPRLTSVFCLNYSFDVIEPTTSIVASLKVIIISVLFSAC